MIPPTRCDALVRELREQGKDAEAITQELRARGIKSAYGALMKRHVVFHKLARFGLNRKADRIRALLLIRQMFVDNVKRREMLARLAIEAPKSLGPWTYERLVDALRSLRRGVQGVPPLPEILPFERDTTMAMELILRRRGERSWRAIAEELNAVGLRPQRAPMFTASQVEGLFQGWRRRQAKATANQGTSHAA